MNVSNIKIERKGYGQYRVTGYVETTKVSFHTTESGMIDAYEDEEAPFHEEAEEWIEKNLINVYEV